MVVIFINNGKSSADYNYTDIIMSPMGINNLVSHLLGALSYSFSNAVSRVPAVPQWLSLGEGIYSKR